MTPNASAQRDPHGDFASAGLTINPTTRRFRARQACRATPPLNPAESD